MHAPGRILIAATTVALGVALTGCGGGSKDGVSCTDSVCTVQSDGPASHDIDQLSTKVTLSSLSANAVTVQINAQKAVIAKNSDPVRLNGFLVTSPETGPDHAKVLVER